MKTARHMHMLMFGTGGGGVNMLSKRGHFFFGCHYCSIRVHSHTFNNKHTLIGDDPSAQ